MSIENHPNFHAVNFVTQISLALHEGLSEDDKFIRIQNAYYASLRGGAVGCHAPVVSDFVRFFLKKPDISVVDIVEFTEHIENMVDKAVEERG